MSKGQEFQRELSKRVLLKESLDTIGLWSSGLGVRLRPNYIAGLQNYYAKFDELIALGMSADEVIDQRSTIEHLGIDSVKQGLIKAQQAQADYQPTSEGV